MGRFVGVAWHPERNRHSGIATAKTGTEGQGSAMKTVMGWIDKIVSSLARRKVNKDEGHSNSR
jgi:hypothetical protein